VVRGLNAARNVVLKHRFGGLIRPQYIYANTKGLCFQTNLEAFYKKSQQQFKALEEKLDEAETNAGKDKETIEELRKKLAIMEDWKLTMQPQESTGIEASSCAFAHWRESKVARSVDDDKVSVVMNLEAFSKETQQRLKALEEKLEEAETNARKAKESIEKLCKNQAIMKEWKLIMEPLESTAAKICHTIHHYGKLHAGRSVDGDKEPTLTGNQPGFHGNTGIFKDMLGIRCGHIDDTNTFHEPNRITHNTAQSSIGIYSSPLQLLYVYERFQNLNQRSKQIINIRQWWQTEPDLSRNGMITAKTTPRTQHLKGSPG